MSKEIQVNRMLDFDYCDQLSPHLPNKDVNKDMQVRLLIMAIVKVTKHSGDAPNFFGGGTPESFETEIVWVSLKGNAISGHLLTNEHREELEEAATHEYE